MESSAGSPAAYCHECHHQWTQRSEHDIICPQCESGFIEVLSGNTDDDPRDDALHIGGLGDVGIGTPTWTVDLTEDQESSEPDNSFWATFTQPRPDTAASASQGRHNVPPPSIPGPFGGIFGMLQNALAAPTTPQGAANDGSGNRTYTWNSPSGNAHFSVSTSTTTFPRGGPITPGSPEATSFMNQMFAAPISPGGTRGTPRSVGGFGGPQDPITLLDILLGSRFAANGQYAHSQEEFDRIISDIMERTSAGAGAPGATEDTITALPKKKADESMLGETGKAECTICMADVTTGDVVTELYCSHWFHTECIKSWLEQHNTCPHCRKSIEEGKAEFDRKQAEGSKTDGAVGRSRGGDSESERKRIRRSRSSQQDNSRSTSGATGSPRMPGAFPSAPSFFRSSSGTLRDQPRNSESNSRRTPTSFRSSSFQSPNDLQTNTDRASSRLQDALRRRPSSPATPTQTLANQSFGFSTSPRRSRSGGPPDNHGERTLHAGFQLQMNESARRAERLQRIARAGGRDEARGSVTTPHSSGRRSSDTGLDRGRLDEHDARNHEHDDHPGLLARARDWLGSR